MLKNYIKVALRNLRKERLYAIINIGGLSIGLASALFIYVYVAQELSYDQFHKNSERIYRVGYEVSLGTGSKVIASSPHRLARHLETDFPELEEVVHFSRLYGGEVAYKDKKLREEQIAFVDSAFLTLFNFNLLKGNQEKALLAPNTVVLTESTAKKYFGDSDPIGNTIKVEEPYSDGDMSLTVTGILEDMPESSHFHIDVLVSMATGNTYFPENLFLNWGWDSHYTYARLPENMTIDKFRSGLKAFGNKHIDGKWFITFFAQPMEEIHLHSNLNSEIEANSDMIYVYIFSIVAIIILVLACVNYMNLATAKAVRRSKEVCVRKVVGAGRKHIISQFLGESISYSILALILGGLIAELASHQIESLLGFAVDIAIFTNPKLLALYTGIGLFIGLLSGSYPAFYISAFEPVRIFKSISGHNKGVVLLRKGLVVFQFALSIALIIGSITIYKQLDFLRNKKIGANVEHNMIIPTSTTVSNKIEPFKNTLTQHPNVQSVTTANRRLGNDINSGTFYEVENQGTKTDARLSNIFVDFNFLEHYDVELLAGRFFSEEIASDSQAVVLNQSALRALDIQSPDDALNKEIKAWFTGKIVGVVQDFHFETVHNKIKPMIFIASPGSTSWISVKMNGENLSETINHIENQWNAIEPKREFRYSFLDDDLYKLYNSEERFSKIFTLFVVLAVLIACLGLLGLVTFSVSQRVKEIGIRKVFGASRQDITFLLTNDFIKLILLANVIAYPVAYYVSAQWLQNFEYKANLPWWSFLLSTLLALLIAVITVSYKSIRAASTKPVDSLNEE